MAQSHECESIKAEGSQHGLEMNGLHKTEKKGNKDH
ncbi:hypothetical protein SAMN06296020_11637 [Anoxynatronum buryatiense]|uniref:Uncharacterized protein n=1 Tax=Anoxynatronum buryatiense TaxID=489973 RepID=A0AA46AK53_9CLOT|nr:hypothetical protein SAMN06296020_11637 [Anoxynatronum buryatiense]